MNILLDTAILQLQQQGGVSRLWRALIPELQRALPEATFTAQLPPDVFISTYYRPAPLGMRSIAVVYDTIGMVYPLIDSNRSDLVDMRRAVREATEVVSISQTTAHDVKRLLGRDSTVAYCGVDTAFGKVLPSDVDKFRQFIGKPYILVVGKRGLYKNVNALYQAWRMWSGAASHRLLCVGGEDGLPQDEAFVARYGDAWLHMQLDDSDLQLAYAGATALVYPSLMEGFGLPIVEAMACACPVIADNSAKEVGGLAPYYVDMTRPRQLAIALNAVLDMAGRMERVLLGVEQSKRYRWATMADTIAGVIRKVCA